MPSSSNKSPKNLLQEPEQQRRQLLLQRPLTLSDTNLYGRQTAMAVLQQALRNVTTTTQQQQQQQQQWVLIQGESGVGKTRLVQEFQSKCRNDSSQPILFITGKFSPSSNNGLSAIIESLDTYCQKNLTPAVMSRLQEELALSNDSTILRLLPSLKQWFLSGGGGATGNSNGDQNDHGFVSSSSSSPSSLLPEMNWTTHGPQIAQALIRFLEALATSAQASAATTTVIVWHMDDWQWSDTEALQWWTTLRTQKNQSHLLVVASFRPVPQDHALTKQIVAWQVSSSSSALGRSDDNLHQITLNNHSVSDLQVFLNDCGILDDDAALLLATTLHANTAGNMLFVRQSLSFLVQRGILSYSTFKCAWTCDVQRLQSELGLQDNVVQMLLDRVKRLDQQQGQEKAPCRLQYVLGVAALVRSKFDVNVLWAILRDNENTCNAVSDLESILHVAVNEGFLKEMATSTSYMFSHDKVQEALVDSLSSSDREHISLLIGQRLLHQHESSSDKDRVSWMLFVAADRLNSLNQQAQVGHLALAQLNFRAGKLAVQTSAFRPASDYFTAAIENLDNLGSATGTVNIWESQYEFCFQLFSTAANVELCLGNFQRGQYLAKQVTLHAKTLDEILSMHRAVSDGLGADDRNGESLELLEGGLRLLGERPRRLLVPRVIADLAYLKKILGSRSDNDILRLPILRDERKVRAIEFYMRATIRCMSTMQPFAMMR